MKRNIARTMFVIFCLATLFASMAAGQTVPLSGHWEGVFTQPKVVPSVQPPTWFILAQGSGEAAQTARFTITIPHYVDLVTLKLTGNWFITPAGNGEDVVMIDLDEQCRFTGPTAASCEGSGTISSGTGKYENATGTVSIKVDINLALRTAKGTFDGTISVPSGN
jgi:hypothetical protein